MKPPALHIESLPLADLTPSARQRESAEVHAHLATVLNQHDPAKGAKDLKRPPAP